MSMEGLPSAAFVTFGRSDGMSFTFVPSAFVRSFDCFLSVITMRYEELDEESLMPKATVELSLSPLITVMYEVFASPGFAATREQSIWLLSQVLDLTSPVFVSTIMPCAHTRLPGSTTAPSPSCSTA